MKFSPTFVENLYAVHYNNEIDHELDRLLNDWTNPLYIFEFYEIHKADIIDNPFISCNTVHEFATLIVQETNTLEDKLYDYKNNNQWLQFFEPLSINQSFAMPLAKLKGKHSLLRLYAIKISKEIVLITGGAIKLTQAMQDHPTTRQELLKIDQCRNFLQMENVGDTDAFLEFINEPL